MSAAPSTATEQKRINYATKLSPKEKMIILYGIMLTVFLAALDSTVVATAQPAIIKQFQAINLISWVTSGYLLATTAMVPVFGKLSDLYGRKLILMTGIVIFLAGSALSGLAGSMTQLILFRVLQGVGSAGISAAAFAVIADLWVPAERARASGLITSVFGLAGVIGPFLGGLLTDTISWRAVFYINVPFGIIALAFLAFKMPRLASGLKAKIDWAGTITILIAVVPFLLALTLDRDDYPWTSPTVLGLFAVAAVGLVAFLIAEAKAESPVLSLSLFKNRTFAVGGLTSFLFGAAYFGSIIYLAVFMVGVLNVSATKAGSTLIPMMIGMVVGAIISTQVTQRTHRYKPFILAGLAITSVGLFIFSRLTADVALGGMTWRMLILGMGTGPVAPLIGLAITNAVPMDKMGAATSARIFFQNIGQTLAVAIFGVVMTTTLTNQLTARMQPIIASAPPAFQQKFDMGQIKNSMSEGSDGAPDITGKIREGVTTAMADERKLIAAALKENNADAQAKLTADPQIPAELKAIVAPGALEGKVNLALNEQLRLLTTALKSGDPQALAAIAANPQVPAQLKQSLAAIPPAAFKDPRTVELILAQAKQTIDAAKPAAVAAARDQAYTQVMAQLDKTEADLLKQGDELGGKVTVAVKESFAAATTKIYFEAIFVCLAGLVITFFLPEIPLRSSNEHVPMGGH